MIGSLATAAPGYNRSEILLIPGGGLQRACARHETPYSLAECRWQIADGALRVDVRIPLHTTADITLPDGTGIADSRITVGSERQSRSRPFNPVTALTDVQALTAEELLT